jgi:hypothetical protein
LGIARVGERLPLLTASTAPFTDTPLCFPQRKLRQKEEVRREHIAKPLILFCFFFYFASLTTLMGPFFLLLFWNETK